MANPNISAMTELNVGTLAWEIEQDGVALIWGNGYSDYNYASSYMRSDTLSPSVWLLRDGDHTLTNTMMFAYWGYDGNTSPVQSAYYDSENMTKLPNAHQSSDGSTDNMSTDMAYILDANINHTTGTNPTRLRLKGDFNTGSGSVSNGTTSASAYFANVDQTTPFSNIRADNPAWTTGQRNQRNAPFFEPIPTQIGDVVLACWAGHYQSRVHIRNANSHVIASVVDTNATSYYHNANHMSYINPRSYEEHVLLQVENGYPGHVSFGGGYGQSSQWSAVNVQSPRTKTELFTVPTGKVIKLNNLYIENPEISGLHVSIDIEGLPTGTTGILNSSAAKVIDSVGTVATTTICKMLKARSGNAVPAMKRPMILTEGDVVKAKVVADESYPEWMAKSCQIVADFEIVT
tara:strand:+ start:413 stop:1624 length:1212 start_codon:yes stop_codon:yes gene_type:complete